MKNRILLIVLLIVVLLLLFKFCNHPVVEPLDDGSTPSVAILGTKILSHTDESIHFSIKFAVFRDSKHDEDQLKSSHVTIDTLKFPAATFIQKRFNKTNEHRKEPFSTVLLLDQSGSMNGNDRLNQRFVAARIFNKNFGQDNHLMLWSFGLRGNSFKSYSDHFVMDTTLFEKQLKELETIRPTGGSPLFAAQDSTLQYLIKHAPTKIKALISLTDGVASKDKNYENVITLSQKNHIPLYNISLVPNSKIQKTQAFETNGAYFPVNDTKQMLSIFGNLGNLINKTATIYDTEWIAIPLKANFGNRGRLRHEMTIQLPYGDEIKLQFELEY